MHELDAAGGTRKYFRLQLEQDSRILCLNTKPQFFGGSGDENSSFDYLSDLLASHGAAAPRLFGRVLAERPGEPAAFLQEDLGDDSLLSRMHTTPHEDGLLDLGLEAVHLLLELQRQLAPPVFDHRRMHSSPWDSTLLLKEESGPWRELLIRDTLKLDLDHQKLEAECRQLALASDNLSRGHFIHRDFQSTNLLFKEGRLRVIDFQGARLGPLSYDLVSLVYDPYMALPPDVRLGLLEEYQEEGYSFHGMSMEALLHECAFTGVQRMMQAQAAYLRIAERTGRDKWLYYLCPAASAMRVLAQDGPFDEYPLLVETAWHAWDKLNREGVERT